MAVLRDAFVSIEGDDLSAHVQSLDLTYESETVDDTAMGDAFRSNAPSLKSWTANITFHESISDVNGNLFAKVGDPAGVVCIFRQRKADDVGATNPSYTGTGIISSYQLFGQSVGDQHTVPVTIVAASDLVRATS
jgi:hypothetical protein